MTKLQLHGKRFGSLVVEGRATDGPNKEARWFCKCACTMNYIAFESYLLSDPHPSCGCYEWKGNNARGKTCNDWTVIGDFDEVIGSGKPVLRCYCACGTERNVETYRLRTGRATHCGCKRKKRKTWRDRLAERQKKT